MRRYIKHTRPTAGYRFQILPGGVRKNIVIASIVGSLSGYLVGYLGSVEGAEIAWEKRKGVQRVFELGGASIGIVLGYHVSFRWKRRKYIEQDEVHGEQSFAVTSDHIIPSNGLLIPKERIRWLFIRQERMYGPLLSDLSSASLIPW